jgi:hypothetical protein
VSAHATGLLRHLREQHARHYPRWGVTGLEVADAGLTFLVCRAESATFGPLTIRVPWRRAIAGHNGGVVEACRLLRQEADMAAFLCRDRPLCEAGVKPHLARVPDLQDRRRASPSRHPLEHEGLRARRVDPQRDPRVGRRVVGRGAHQRRPGGVLPG